eukprot:CAMPEP_0171362822 /NCGR_PEP_ID=MMETSP0879-20121228/2931_1 /TAXON_ID=67004 /ORGANISM="Thalassiosira weissflogii, Strain CCMP1336" /LENGTH=760 /DNA_ID=CAMNT_0011869837 /DNA_START=218 /DNA_END=2497 /DNA_ORIENTATION=+
MEIHDAEVDSTPSSTTAAMASSHRDLSQSDVQNSALPSTNPHGNTNQTDRYAYYERSPSANKSNGDYHYKQQPKATSFMSAVSKQMVNDRRKWNRPVGGGVAPGASAAGGASAAPRPGPGPGPGPPQQPFGRPLDGPNTNPSRSVHYKDPTHYRQPDFQRSALEQDGNYYYEQQPKATSYMSAVAKNMEGVPRQYWKSEGRTRTRPVHEAGNGGVDGGGGVGDVAAGAAGRRARMRRSGSGPGVTQMRDMRQRQLRQQQFMEREQRRRDLRNRMTRPPPPQYYEPAEENEEFDYQFDDGRIPPSMNLEDEDDDDDDDFYYDDDGEDDDDDDYYDDTPRYDTRRKPRRKNRNGRSKSPTSRRRRPQSNNRYDAYEEDDDEETYFSTPKSKRKIRKDNDDTDEEFENYFLRTKTKKDQGQYMPSQKENLSNSININIFPNGKGEYTMKREDRSSSNRNFDDAADVGARTASFTADNRIDYITDDDDEDEPFQSFAYNEVKDRVRQRRLKQQPPPMPPPTMEMEDQLPPPPPPHMPPPPEFFDESFFHDELYHDFDRLGDMDDMMLDDMGMPLPPPRHLDEMPPPGQQQQQQQQMSPPPPPPHMQHQQQQQQQQQQNHRNQQTQSDNSEEHMKTIPPPPSNPYQMRNKSANARESDNSQNPGYYYAQQPRGTSFISNISKQELEERRQLRRLRREPLLTPESNVSEMDMEMEMEEDERFMREFPFDDERDMIDGGGAMFYGNDREYFDFGDVRGRGYLDEDRR